MQALFSSWTLPELQVFRSPAQHYRMRCVLAVCPWLHAPAGMADPELPCRAEFGVWHDKGQVYYIMHEQVSMQLGLECTGQRCMLSDEASAQPASQPASSQPGLEASPAEAATEAAEETALAAAGAATLSAAAAAQDGSAAAGTSAEAPAGKQGKGRAGGQKRPRDFAAGPARRRVDQFPRASRLMNELMAAVMRHANGDPVLSHKLFQVLPWVHKTHMHHPFP